jgi:hypothetical protein
MCGLKVDLAPTKILSEQVVHVEWWDNFSKCYAFQKQDMTRSNFSLNLWTVMGVQRQSLPTQPHRLQLSGSELQKCELLSVEDFIVNNQSTPAMPDDILDIALIRSFKINWLDKVDKVQSFWKSSFRAKSVTRVPLKLPNSEGFNKCGNCDRLKCSCFINSILATQRAADSDGKRVSEEKQPTPSELMHSVHLTDNVSGSPDGLLNFFPHTIKKQNIGSKVGLSRILAEFNMENRDNKMVKIVNTDVQIYERILKVRGLVTANCPHFVTVEVLSSFWITPTYDTFVTHL